MPTHKLLPTSLVIALTSFVVSGGGYLGVGQATPATNTHQNQLLSLPSLSQVSPAQASSVLASKVNLTLVPNYQARTVAPNSHFKLWRVGLASNLAKSSHEKVLPTSQHLALTQANTPNELTLPLSWAKTPIDLSTAKTTTVNSGGIALALASQNFNVNADHSPVSEKLEDYSAATITDRVYSKNALTLYSEGFVPIFAGNDLIFSTANPNGQLSFKSPLKTTNKASEFMGTNVRSALVDGEFNPQAIANVWEYKPIEIDLSNINGYTRPYDKLAAGTQHGFAVGSIIAASRKANNVGLTPYTQLYYAQINKNAQAIGQIYLNTYDQSHPAVINNSINFGNDENNGTTTAINNISFSSTNKISSTNLNTLINYAKTAPTFTSAYAGLKALSSRQDAPLIVFSAGNYGAGLNVKTDSSIINKIKSEHSSLDRLYQFIKDPNQGLAITSDTALNHLLKDQQVKQNLLVVASNYFDPDYTYNSRQYEWKFKNLLTADQQKTAQQTGKLLSPEAYKQQLTQNSSRNQANNQYVSALGAYQCGVAKEHCLTVSYRYDYPDQFRSVISHGFEIGTSISAPVVSAVAIMLKQQFPWFSAANLKETILTTATDVGKPGIDEVFGWGVLNANKALHGPAQFHFSDFKANLAYRDLSTSQVQAGTPDNFTQHKTSKFSTAPQYQARNSYFTNDISGNYGLEVSGTKQDFLFLTGNNTYKGNTTVKSGNLVVVSPTILDLSDYTANDSYPYATISSPQTTIAKGASLYANYAHFKNLESHGTTALLHSKVDGNLTLDTTDNVYLALPSTSIINYKVVLNDTPLVVTGDAQLSGNLVITDNDQIDVDNPKFGQMSVGDAYIPEGNGDVNQVLLVANKITGKFTSYNLHTDSVFKTYSLDYKSNPKALSVKVSLKSRQEVTTKVLENNSLIDQQNMLIGAAYIDQIFNFAYLSNYERKSKSGKVSTNAGATTLSSSALSTTSGTNAVAVSSNSHQISIWEAAAGRIQNMNLTQYQNLLLRSAATIYADARRAISQLGLTQVKDFGELVTDRFASNDHKLRTYVNTGYANSQWKHRDSSIVGQQELTTQSFGFYKQSSGGINAGVVVNYNKGNWYEHSTFKDNVTDLGEAQITNLGGIISIGQGFETSYYGVSLFSNIQNYDLSRASLSSTYDQKANFRVYDSGLNIRYGILDAFDDNSGLVFNTGFNLLAHIQTKINEKATGSQALYASAFSLRSPNQVSAVNSFDLGTKYYNKFTLFGKENNLSLLFNARLNLGNNNYSVGNVLFTSGNSFTNYLITDIKLDYNLKLNVHLSVNVSANYTYAIDNSSFAGKVGLTYAF